MKKISKLLIVALCATMFCTACDEDEPAGNLNLASAAGMFVGSQNTDVTVMGMNVPVESNDVKAVVEVRSDSICTVTIEDFSYNNDNYGDIVVEGAKIKSVTDSQVVFAGSGKCKLKKNETEYTADIASLTGTYVDADGSLKLEAEVNLPVSPKMTIKFLIEYNGKR